MTTGVFSEVFSPNRKVASDVRALLGQYETLQGDGDLLTTNQKNNLTVHEMTTNNRKSFFFFVQNLVCQYHGQPLILWEHPCAITRATVTFKIIKIYYTF